MFGGKPSLARFDVVYFAVSDRLLAANPVISG